jgi:tetratricopeptide (TPR) repeat protein
MTRMLRAALLAGALAAAPAASAGVAESWYLSRGRANMKIANYAAAIEAYEKALAQNPASREASRGVALARLRNGETDRAVAALDRHLARFRDDAELAFEQARILQWSRYAYRSGDAVRYLRMGLEVRDDPARRRDLARLLGRDRTTLDEALREYDRLVAAAPADEPLREERLKLLLWDPRHRGRALRELEALERERPGDERVARHLARLVGQDPARAEEAVARHERLLARHPHDPELRLGHARALARAGRRDEARAAYERAVALRPTDEARLEHADLLAADPRTRDAARAEYEAVLRARPASRRARVGLARVLGARQETSPAAIAHYEEVLRASPRDAEAHRGLAHALAWTGDPDRALAHGALATRYGRPQPDVARLERSLRRGREPALGAGARAVAQPGGAFALSAFSAYAAARGDPTPFTSSAIEGGVHSYRGERGRAQGTYVDARGEWRPAPDRRLRLGFGWDGARLDGRGLFGEVGYERHDAGRTLAVAIARTARRDSFRALAGEVVDGREVGAASDDAAALGVTWEGERDRVALSARGGFVRGAGMRSTFLAAVGGRADRALVRSGPWTFALGASAEASHHARDLSGLSSGDPAAARLFSPPFFLAASPRLALVRDAGLAGRLEAEAGPAVQVTGGSSGGVLLGGDVRLSVAQRLGDRVRLGVEARAERIADVYERLELSAAASILF